MSDKKEVQLVETVTEALGKMIEADTVKDIITKQIESTITDIVSHSMRSYSGFGKIISEKINSVIHIAASNVELPEYTKFVSDCVIDQFDQVLKAQAQEQLKELIQNEFGPMQSGVMTAQQFYDHITSCFETDEWQEEREIEVQLEETDRDVIYIKIIDEEKSEEVKLSFYNWRNEEGFHIGYIESGGWNHCSTRVSERSLNTHCMDKLEKFVFRMYCAQTKVDMSDISMFDDFSVGGHDY